MALYTREFTEEDAMAVCNWKYQPPYDIYNCPDWETVQKENWGMANKETRADQYYSVCDGEELIGYFRLKKQDNCIMLGLGLRTDLCGSGYGTAMMMLVNKTAAERYKGMPLRLEVRKFNKRAMKCYQTAGFIIIDEYDRPTPTGTGDFYLMQYRGVTE